jgi:hypothetical protein
MRGLIRYQLRLRRPALGTLLLIIAGSWLAPAALAQTLHSASVDDAGERIVVRGAGFDGSTAFTLGGVAVPTANVTPTALDIPFGTEVADAVQWRGSYRLVADGSAWLSLYSTGPIEVPDDPPPPPPPPPPAGTDCPCIPGWEASGIPKDSLTLCFWDFNSQQQWMSGQRGPWFISTALDPYNLIFDPVDPGNSVSYCALHDGTDWTVAEPVVNQAQFDDCANWMWMNICL